MRSPLKDNTNSIKSLSVIKGLIPIDSHVNTSGIYSGNLELNLASDQRIVTANTYSYLVYEFWKTIIDDAPLVADVAAQLSPIENEKVFQCWQEAWPWYKDSQLRSAIYFLLNRYSSQYLSASGEFTPNQFDPHAITQLSKFKTDKVPFSINWHAPPHFSILLKRIAEDTKKRPNSYCLLSMGKYIHDYYSDVNPSAYDIEVRNHKEVYSILSQNEDIRWIVCYKRSKAIAEIYKKYNITLADKYGKSVDTYELCEEMIIANY